MIAHSTNARLALFWALYIILLGGSYLRAQNVQLPDAVQAALERYTALDPLAVTWSQKIEAAEMGKQKLAADLLARVISYNTNVRQIAFRGGRIYFRRESNGNLRPPLRKAEFAFDGNVLYMGSPADTRHKSGFLQKLLPKNDLPYASYIDSDYFRGAGIRMPFRVEELVDMWRPQAELMALLAEGGRVERTGAVTVEGQPLVWVQVTAKDWSLAKDWALQRVPSDLLKAEDLSKTESQLPISPPSPTMTKRDIQRKLNLQSKIQKSRVVPVRRHDFYLDPECGYAVRRLEIRDDAHHLLMRSHCTEHEKLTGRDIWLPRRCQVEEYTVADVRDEETLIPKVFASPLYVCQCLVTDFDLQPWPYERFELKYTAPGTSINNGTLAGVKGRNGVAYKIPANPQQLDQVIEAAKAQHGISARAEKRSHTWKKVFLVANIALLLGAVVYFLVRWRRKARRA